MCDLVFYNLNTKQLRVRPPHGWGKVSVSLTSGTLIYVKSKDEFYASSISINSPLLILHFFVPWVCLAFPLIPLERYALDTKGKVAAHLLGAAMLLFSIFVLGPLREAHARRKILPKLTRVQNADILTQKFLTSPNQPSKVTITLYFALVLGGSLFILWASRNSNEFFAVLAAWAWITGLLGLTLPQLLERYKLLKVFKQQVDSLKTEATTTIYDS